jgi:hypothetical protein
LTTSDAPLIRSDYGTGLFTKQALAEKYHVHPDTITNILGRCEDQDVYRRISTPGNLLITPVVFHIILVHILRILIPRKFPRSFDTVCILEKTLGRRGNSPDLPK